MQQFKVKKKQRIWHDFNNTAMDGHCLQAIGAAFAEKDRNIYCIVGDGSLMMNLQELTTIVHHNLKIKLVCFNNYGYSMIKQTQEQWMNSEYFASSDKGGLGFPNFCKVVNSFGIKSYKVNKEAELQKVFQESNKFDSQFIEIRISPEARVIPQVKFGRPNEDQEPLLERSEFLKEMIVKPHRSRANFIKTLKQQHWL